MIKEDFVDDEPAPLPEHSQTFALPSIPLGKLFDSSANNWAHNYHVMGQGLREEALLPEVVEGIVE